MTDKMRSLNALKEARDYYQEQLDAGDFTFAAKVEWANNKIKKLSKDIGLKDVSK